MEALNYQIMPDDHRQILHSWLLLAVHYWRDRLDTARGELREAEAAKDKARADALGDDIMSAEVILVSFETAFIGLGGRKAPAADHAMLSSWFEQLVRERPDMLAEAAPLMNTLNRVKAGLKKRDKAAWIITPQGGNNALATTSK